MDINAIIEIPMQSSAVKYECDKASGALVVDRFLSTCMYYPCNYGYIPQTLSLDGDPCDILVITPMPLAPQCRILCRPIGMLKMEDDAGIDPKILAVPDSSITTLYDNVHEFTALPDLLLKQIEHFFMHYKDLEAGKTVDIQGWAGAKEAIREINNSKLRYTLSL